MKTIKVRDIQGKEILGQPIFNSNGVMLIPDGTVIKKDYIQTFLDLGVEEIQIKEELYVGIDYDEMVDEEVKEECYHLIKDIVKNQTKGTPAEDVEIGKVTEEILQSVMNQEEVFINVNKIRSSDHAAYEHAINVAALSTIVALKLQIPRHSVKEYAIGALLHDIGMTFVPAVFRNEFDDDLGNSKVEVVKNHVFYGLDHLKKKDTYSDMVLDIVRNHHERIDGSGYPSGLIGTNIDRGSRIIAVCDIYDAITSKRSYHEAYLPSEAVEYLYGCVGSGELDLDIVTAFLRRISPYPKGSFVKLSNMERGVVISQNKENICAALSQYELCDCKILNADADFFDKSFAYIVFITFLIGTEISSGVASLSTLSLTAINLTPSNGNTFST